MGYSVINPDGGPTLFYFHVWPGSRLEAEAFEPEARRAGCRIVAVDRPGYGLSDFQQERTICDWPDDIAELADHLAADRFGVVGVSGGGPYAAACAWKLSDRLSAAGIVCGMGPLESSEATRDMMPFNRLMLYMARNHPRLGSWVFNPIAALVRRYPGIIASPLITASIPEIDRQTLRDPFALAVLKKTIPEAFRNGPAGAKHDGLLYARPWGFALEEIKIPVYLWHGELDVHVPVEMGRLQAQRIPDCRALFYPEEGHLSLPLSRAGEILRRLVGS